MNPTCARTAVVVALAAAVAAGCGSEGGGQMSSDGGADAGGAGAVAGVVAAGVRWFGRVDTTTDPAHPRFAWSNTGFVAQFSGTSISMDLSVSGAMEIFKTVIDGVVQMPFNVPATGTYPLVTGYPAGSHTVEVYRQTEGAQGESQLMGLTVGDGALMDPPPGPGRLIEVIGDSITCGYGDLGTSADLNASGDRCYATESAWDSYGFQTAYTLQAEASIIAASGRGVVRNYGGDTSGTMPMLYPNTLTNLGTPAWDFHIQPQAVIINLGTNDISNSKGDPGVAFRDTYVTLLETVRGHYPSAFIVCIIGPLTTGNDLTILKGYISDAVGMRNAAGDANVEFFDRITPQSSTDFACQYHPDAPEHMMMAALLAPELKAKLGW
jgi:lysophospholipase L1-like esterase